jgi:hypothetical protein
MFDNKTLREHLRFIADASDHELSEREDLYVLAIGVLDRTSDRSKDMKFLLRKLRDEKAARLEVLQAATPRLQSEK